MVRKGGELTYSSIAMHLEIDNKTVFSYLLKMGGSYNKELLHISKSIWSYLLSKQIAMSSEYLPSALNVHADWESRNAKDNSEWKLDVSVFQKIITHMEQPILHLFASRLCHQLPRYNAWKPQLDSIAQMHSCILGTGSTVLFFLHST